MRHRHGGRGVERLAVNLGLVAGHDGGVIADEPLTADRESSESTALRDARFLEETEAAAASSDKDKFGALTKGLASGGHFHGHNPIGAVAFQAHDAVAGRDAATRLTREPTEEFARHGAEIHIRAGVHFGGGDRDGGASLGEQRSPAGDFRAVGAEGHLAKERMSLKRGVAGAQKADHFIPVHETQVRHRANEVPWCINHALGDGRGPKLFGALELGVYFNGVGNVHCAIGILVGRVAEFAKARVAGAGVVPTMGGLVGEFGGSFVNLNTKRRLKAFEQRAEIGGHNATPDNDDI